MVRPRELLPLMDEIVAAYRDGVSLRRLALRYGTSRPSLNVLFKECGVELLDSKKATGTRAQVRRAQMLSRTKGGALDEAGICQAYVEGLSLDAIRSRFRVSPDIVKAVLDEHKVPRRDMQEILRLRKASRQNKPARRKGDKPVPAGAPAPAKPMPPDKLDLLVARYAAHRRFR